MGRRRDHDRRHRVRDDQRDRLPHPDLTDPYWDRYRATPAVRDITDRLRSDQERAVLEAYGRFRQQRRV